MDDLHPPVAPVHPYLRALLRVWNNTDLLVYTALGLTLLLTAIGALLEVWSDFLIPWLQGMATLDALEVLDHLLLVSMLAEILQMVKISLTQRRLFSEPFLIVGLISVVRRILIITAEGTRYFNAQRETHFLMLMLELVILGGLLVALVGGIQRLRQQRLEEARRLRSEKREHPADTPSLAELLSGR
ncbi:MAG: hypothetical protein D6755_12775 [Anaerolineae bacterium]|nr:MAG: hypothetical protein D6755_12775 [Anaerolineae bacterium]